ncbi:hypothetical protein WG926_24680 [Tistrella sp. BH-R2-4]|jgi:hypothetical protein|uniref:DUF3649 domain-containing protein n=1 Tax=Tistrella arctica TaxID=3133430 RepID=A0ABU9YRV1_9PROT
MATQANGAGERLPHAVAVILRVIAAVAVGYGLGALVTILLARHLPIPARDATQAGVMAGFLVHGGIIIWAFAARTTLRAWGWLAVPALPLILAWRLT